MTEIFLYRYRSITSLLDEHEELERQTIYFANREQLNDPMEGSQDVFWSGDYVLWKSLIRHYALCLSQAVSCSAVFGPEFNPRTLIPVLSWSVSTLPTDALKDQLTQICAAIFSDRGLVKILKKLSATRLRVNREELIFYLSHLHPIVLSHVMLHYEARGLLKYKEPLKFPKHMGRSITTGLDTVLSLMSAADRSENAAMPAVMEAAASTMHQMSLIFLYNHDDSNVRHWNFVFAEFPYFYCLHIASTLFPEWFAACFSEDAGHAAMWGHYSGRHEGVCLKFRVSKDGADRLSLNLKGIVGSGKGVGGKYDVVGDRRIEFEKVSYSKRFPEIDFFKSLGRLSVPAIHNDWLRYGEEKSDLLSPASNYEEVVRATYWANYGKITTTKFVDWSYEKEYRLVLRDPFLQASEHGGQLLQYNFADLAGIVFGFNTKINDKLRIMRIIDAKCSLSSRKNFAFAQAAYSTGAERFDVYPLDLIKST